MLAREVQFGPRDFERLDESDDALFYRRDRMVQHLDATALATVEGIIGSLITEKEPRILDLMASWDSHIPESTHPAEVVGLGLNDNELAANKRLNRYLVHDLNAEPRLPFADDSFDVVLCTVSVDYMTRPVEVFAEVRRVLRPGGLFLVIFSDRWFEPKVTNVWRASGEAERLLLVEEFFRAAGGFGKTRIHTSKGQPRPADDKYAHLGIPSDPVYAVFADKKGAPPKLRPLPAGRGPSAGEREELRRRSAAVAETLRCPHCGESLRKWAVPQTPFTEWDNEYMYICFNDECRYLRSGWDSMSRQGNYGVSYRFMFNPVNKSCLPIPVQSLGSLRDGIID